MAVAKSLWNAGFEAYFAGGCVRDELLGLEPADFDIATSAYPEQVARLFERVIPVGVQFGVVLVVVDSIPIEVATFRAESGYSDGRRPDDVVFADLETDVRRRDFTINGMMKHPLTGEIIDLVGGRRDLQLGVVRTIGDAYERFGEDRLRMMRAIRFAARLGFFIEKRTSMAIREMADQILLVAPERIFDEMTRIITGPNRAIALLAMHDLGLLLPYFPELHHLRFVPQSPDHHPEGDVFMHTVLALQCIEEPVDETLAWAVLLHDVGKLTTARRIDGRIRFFRHEHVGARIARRICKRMRMSRNMQDTIEFLVSNHMMPLHCPKMRKSKLHKLLSNPNIDLLLELHRCDSIASNGRMESYEFCKQQLAEFRASPKLQMPISGKDLIAAGYGPGPLIGKILHAVEDALIEGKIHSKEEAMRFVANRFPLKEPIDGDAE